MKKAEPVTTWIKERRKEARKLFRDAEDRRDKSSYTDLEALEQSAYNQGVLCTLDKIEQLLK